MAPRPRPDDAAKPTPPAGKAPEEEVPAGEAPEKGTKKAANGKLAPAMSHEDIAGAGQMVDLPYESPPGDPAPLQYADDLPDEKGWTPPEGFTIAGVPFDEVVAGIGGGAMPQQPTEVADEQPPQAPEPG